MPASLEPQDDNLAASSWLIVAAGFHFTGGMDKANAELAAYLAERGARVHLVAHDVDARLTSDSALSVHIVRRPAGSFALGEFGLDRRGRDVARSLLAADPDARVVVNGGNCQWPDINWVHYVHHAWNAIPADAPLWFRMKHAAFGARWRSAERAALRKARVVIANSNVTRADVTTLLDVPAERVRTVYLGADRGARAPAGDRAAARASLALDPERPAVAFVGGLGLDRRKGFDTLWNAWAKLSASSNWDPQLVVAGGGAGLPAITAEVKARGLQHRVRLLGHSDRVRDVLAAVDLLVSPTRYEPYGLNVHEALCMEVPALVSRRAGVAERFPAALSDMLLNDPEDVQELVTRLLLWRSDLHGWKSRIAAFSRELRSYDWRDMAAAFVAAVSPAAQRCGEGDARVAAR